MSVKHLVPVVLPADPVSALEAAPKQYVDAKPGFNFIQEAQPTATTPGQTWFNTATGDSFVWVVDINSSQWVQTGPGSPPGQGVPPGGATNQTLTKLSAADYDVAWKPGGGSGFTFVQDTAPTPTKVGDTWFDLSTAASGGTSWVAIEEAPGGEIVWVQFAPGTAAVLPPTQLIQAHQWGDGSIIGYQGAGGYPASKTGSINFPVPFKVGTVPRVVVSWSGQQLGYVTLNGVSNTGFGWQAMPQSITGALAICQGDYVAVGVPT